MWICMEYMNASLHDVYNIIHQMKRDTIAQIDDFLRRILRDVK